MPNEHVFLQEMGECDGGKQLCVAGQLKCDSCGALRDARSVVIDLDMATATEIERLPYVGRVLAARIVANRDSCGTFGSIEGLKRVFGIGDGMARRLAPLVTFSSASSPLGTAQGASCPSADNRAALRRRGRPR